MAKGEPRRVRLRDVAEHAGRLGRQRLAGVRPAGTGVGRGAQSACWRRPSALGYPGPDPAARRLRTGTCGSGRADLRGASRATSSQIPPRRRFSAGSPVGWRSVPFGLLLIPDSRLREESAPHGQRGGRGRVHHLLGCPRTTRGSRPRSPGGCRLSRSTSREVRPPRSSASTIVPRRAAAAEHVRELGHERIAVLSFVTALDPAGELELDLTVERLEGFKEGLREAWDPSLVRTCRPNASEPAREAHPRAASRPGSADGDSRHERHPRARRSRSSGRARRFDPAAAVGRRLRRQSRGPSTRTPPLTTVAQPHEEKGRLASQWLMEAIAGGMRSTRPAGAQDPPDPAGRAAIHCASALSLRWASDCAGCVTHFRRLPLFRCVFPNRKES